MKYFKVYTQETVITYSSIMTAVNWFHRDTGQKPHYIYANETIGKSFGETMPRGLTLDRFDRLLDNELMLSVYSPLEVNSEGELIKQRRRTAPVNHEKAQDGENNNATPENYKSMLPQGDTPQILITEPRYEGNPDNVSIINNETRKGRGRPRKTGVVSRATEWRRRRELQQQGERLL